MTRRVDPRTAALVLDPERRARIAETADQVTVDAWRCKTKADREDLLRLADTIRRSEFDPLFQGD